MRIGSKCAPDLQRFSIYEKADEVYSQRRANPSSSSFNGRRYGALKREKEECAAALDAARARLNDTTFFGPKSWRSVFQPHLAEWHSTECELLTVPRSILNPDGGFKTKGVTHDYLWKRWIAGKGMGAVASSAPSTLWRLDLAARQRRKSQWEEELSSGLREQCADLMGRYESARETLADLRKDNWRVAISRARVIGCTTTGAAKFKDLLNDADLGVLLVEEAAEVLESHTLTSLQPDMKHIIMIGDHKQLRPKLEHFDLTVASGGGHDFNTSLFERLVAAGVAHGTLEVQHRMRPEICDLIRPTYPALRDAPGTSGRPHVRGLSSDVVFLNHSVPEDSCANASADPSHRANSHEVALVVSTVRYLLQQGHRSDQIVVLTPLSWPAARAPKRAARGKVGHRARRARRGRSRRARARRRRRRRCSDEYESR